MTQSYLVSEESTGFTRSDSGLDQLFDAMKVVIAGKLWDANVTVAKTDNHPRARLLKVESDAYTPKMVNEVVLNFATANNLLAPIQ